MTLRWPPAAPPPLGLVLRTGPDVPTQAELLAFDGSSGQAAPLATFAAVSPTGVQHVIRADPESDYNDWLDAHPTSIVARVHHSGVQAHYATQAERDAALNAALRDPDVAGVFTPRFNGYWTFPEPPVAGEPFVLFSAFYGCDGDEWWGITPLPYLLDVSSDPIRLESPGHLVAGCLPLMPPLPRSVNAWQLPGLPAGDRQIDLYRLGWRGRIEYVDSVSISVAGGAGFNPGPAVIPAIDMTGAALLVIACCVAGLVARGKLRG